jgi:AcrR family transcriptional regulator
VLAGRAEELPELTDELTDWMLSVAHEEVATFFVPRSRPAGGIVGDRLPLVGVIPTSRESVADASRRAVMAAARLAAAEGPAGLTSAKIRKDAGLSRTEFERHFTGVEDCFLDAVESVATMAASVAESAGAGAISWERRIFKWMSALCALAAGERDLSRLVLLDVMAPGRPGLLRREELIGRAAEAIRDLAPRDRRPSDLAASASVCAIWRIAETEVSARRTTDLPRLAAVFVYMILAARRSRGQATDRAQVSAPSPAEMRYPIAASLEAPAG